MKPKKISRKRLIDLKYCADGALDWTQQLLILHKQPPSTAFHKENKAYCVNRIQMLAQTAIRNILAILK